MASSESLRALRADAVEEVLVGVQRGADLSTLRQLAQLVAEVDQRLDRSRPDPLQARQRIAATKRPTFNGNGGRRG